MNSHHPSDQEWDWEAARRLCLPLARRMLGSHQEAEEAVQEALLRAWRKRDQCRSLEQRGGWLSGITRNEALRVIERRKETIPLELATVPEQPPGDDGIIDRLAVQRALADLPERDRELRYDEDLTQSVVAERTGTPEGTVKVRLHRLRTQLRSVLKESI